LKLSFHGGAGTVTGSKTLVSAAGMRVLVDAGMFQGMAVEGKNFDPPGFDPKSVSCAILTHAHVDHVGLLPRIVTQGFQGDVYCTPATAELANLLLLDSAHLQQEQAEFANRKGYSSHKPALPLYTVEEAEAAAKLLRPVPYGRLCAVSKDFSFRFNDAGHILGSANVEIMAEGKTVVFSGDIGNWDVPILKDPTAPTRADAVVCESTYGDRTHPHPGGKLESLAEVVTATAKRGGVIVVPAFAVGRAQELLYDLGILFKEGRAPKLPVYLDSPMAVSATEIFRRHPECFDAEMQARLSGGEHPLDFAEVHLVRTQADSKKLNDLTKSAIILSASGMAEGGRVVHHLLHRLPNPKDAVVFVGYQGAGTRGRQIADGAKSVRIFGNDVPIRASVTKLDGFSAHADQSGILRWLKLIGSAPPKRVLLNHGDPGPAGVLAALIKKELGIEATPVKLGDEIEV